MDAMDTDHAALTTNVLVIIVLMVIQPGQILIAPEELVPNLPLGLEPLRMLTMLILLWSVPTKELVTENLVNASASPITMELHVNAPFAQTDAVMLVFVSLKNSWPLKLVAFTPLLGMPRSKLDAFVTLEDVDLTAHCVS
jgi:hypothetical protein